jgi:hypothetical protein
MANSSSLSHRIITINTETASEIVDRALTIIIRISTFSDQTASMVAEDLLLPYLPMISMNHTTVITGKITRPQLLRLLLEWNPFFPSNHTCRLKVKISLPRSSKEGMKSITFSIWPSFLHRFSITHLERSGFKSGITL